MHSVPSLDAVLSAESVELLADVLAALVVAQSEHLAAGLGLRMRLELLEGGKRLGLRLHEQDSSQTRRVVDEGDPVAIARVCAH